MTAKRGKSVGYFDVDGNRIDLKTWTRLRGDKDYVFFEKYENDHIAVHVEWLGKVDDQKATWMEYWRMYAVRAFNIIVTGDRPGTFVRKRVEDPAITKYFLHKKDAVAYYNEVLLKVGQTEVDATTGETVVTDNKLAKPLPDSPDTPKTKSAVVGSW